MDRSECRFAAASRLCVFGGVLPPIVAIAARLASLVGEPAEHIAPLDSERMISSSVAISLRMSRRACKGRRPSLGRAAWPRSHAGHRASEASPGQDDGDEHRCNQGGESLYLHGSLREPIRVIPGGDRQAGSIRNT